MKKEGIRTCEVRFEMRKICVTKGILATGVSQVSALLQKELVICRTICYNRTKKIILSFRNPNGGSNLFGNDVTD